MIKRKINMFLCTWHAANPIAKIQRSYIKWPNTPTDFSYKIQISKYSLINIVITFQIHERFFAIKHHQQIDISVFYSQTERYKPKLCTSHDDKELVRPAITAVRCSVNHACQRVLSAQRVKANMEQVQWHRSVDSGVFDYLILAKPWRFAKRLTCIVMGWDYKVTQLPEITGYII